MMPAAGDNPKQFKWLFDPDAVSLCGTVAEVVTALNEISLTRRCFDAPLFSTPVTLHPHPSVFFPIQTHVKGSHAKTVTKDHTASRAPACARSAARHSEVN